MTMPTAAAAVTAMGGLLPSEMTDKQLAVVVGSFREDLGSRTIDFVEQALPRSIRCECGALHLRVDDPQLDDVTRSSLFRLVASPFGAVLARHYGFDKLRFGWEGLEVFLPSFVTVVDCHGLRTAWGHEVPDDALSEVVAAIRQELPGVMEIAEASAKRSSGAGEFYSYVVTPEMAGGKSEWSGQVYRLMMACATPVRKFIDEHLKRHYGVQGGAVNCCIFPTMVVSVDPAKFEQLRWDEQVRQQLTPDC